MRRYWIIVSLVFTSFLALFLLVESINPDLFANLENSIQARTFATALVGIGLLTVDVLLPIPASLIMISNGALFGIALGTLLSVIGSMSAAALGFLIGRWGGSWLTRTVSPEEMVRANQLLEEWGWLAIVMTRPLPLLAETTVIMAGASTMRWRTLLSGALVGTLPTSLLYALVGKTWLETNSFQLSALIFLTIAAIFWLLNQWIRQRSGVDRPTTASNSQE